MEEQTIVNMLEELIDQNAEILAIMRFQSLSEEEVEQLKNMVGAGKFPSAYYYCNGWNSQADISKLSGVDAGNLSKKLKEWETAGIVIRNKRGNPVRLYQLIGLPMQGS